jgi:porin
LRIHKGFSNYPLSAWGARLKIKPFEGDSYIQAGAFEVTPHLADRNGFQFSFKQDTGTVIPIEAGWVVGAESRGTLGTYEIGGYYDMSDREDQLEDESGVPYALTGAAPRRHGGCATLYAMADQMVARFGGDPERPLTLLAGVTYAPADRDVRQGQPAPRRQAAA